MVVGETGLRKNGTRWLAGVATACAIGVAASLHAVPAQAQSGQPIPCAETGQPLVRIPELRSQGGKLTGTIVLINEMQRLQLARRVRATPGPPCREQDVRQFRGRNTVPAEYPGMDPVAAPPATGLADPVPGPTLRARVGDLVQLTFLNHISTSGFWKTLDRGERERPGAGCDQNPSGPYPGPDTFPNCFHGSSTGNIHFHGTHTTPSTTGDNIFIQVRPSIRGRDDRPIVTERSVKAPFAKFFAACEAELKKDVLSQWPRTWGDLPKAWTDEQKRLLKRYDEGIVNKLSPVNAEQIKAGGWPQYYIGAFPFCFRLPEYTAKNFPPEGAVREAAHGPAAATDKRVLQMGQAPGVHWYHGHKHGSTTINVFNGMTGAFVIEGKYDDDLNRFYGAGWTRRQPLLTLNQFQTVPFLFAGPGGGNPTPFSVNGRLQPRLTMRSGEVQLWRVANTGGHGGAFFEGMYTVPFPDPSSTRAPFEWKQLAQDGVQFAEVNYDKSKDRPFLLAAGNRADVLVKAPVNTTGKPQAFALVIREATNRGETTRARQQVLLTVSVEPGPDVTGNQSAFISGKDYPTFPPFLADITAADVKATRTLSFESSAPRDWPESRQRDLPFTMHTIDGKKFDGNVGQVVLLNTVEEWKIENRTADKPDQPGRLDHPFHIHINPFQVVEEFDPHEPLISPTTGQAIIDTSDPDKTKHAPYFKYAVDTPARTIEGAQQCAISSKDPATWKPCGDKWQAPNRTWWDVFPIPSARRVGDVVIPGYFKMRSRFVDYAGHYVLHCHILAHEDRGMMTIVQVVPYHTPYSHR